jgi:hypothetical protein
MAKKKTTKRKTAVKRKPVKRVTKKKVTKKIVTKRTVKRKPAKKRVTPRVTTSRPMHVMEEKPTPLLGIIVLLLNALVLPGLGSLIAKKVNSGLLQLILAILGQLFLGQLVHTQLALGLGALSGLQITGLVLVIISWIWGVFSGIDVIRKSI